MNTHNLTVFVYGTLKPGGYYWNRFCEGKVASIVEAKVRGKLYDLHLGYPGIRLEGLSWVFGYKLNLKDQSVLADIDALEGYFSRGDSRKNEYVRHEILAYSIDEHSSQKVWIYEISEEVLKKQNGTLLPSGDWPL